MKTNIFQWIKNKLMHQHREQEYTFDLHSGFNRSIAYCKDCKKLLYDHVLFLLDDEAFEKMKDADGNITLSKGMHKGALIDGYILNFKKTHNVNNIIIDSHVVLLGSVEYVLDCGKMNVGSCKMWIVK